MKLTEDTLLYACMIFNPHTKDLTYSQGINKPFSKWIEGLLEEEREDVLKMLNEEYFLVKEYPSEDGEGSLLHYTCEAEEGWVMNYIQLKIMNDHEGSQRIEEEKG